MAIHHKDELSEVKEDLNEYLEVSIFFLWILLYGNDWKLNQM